MARSIQEGDGLAVDLRLIRADVLGDAAGLAGSHGGVPDGIQHKLAGELADTMSMCGAHSLAEITRNMVRV